MKIKTLIFMAILSLGHQVWAQNTTSQDSLLDLSLEQLMNVKIISASKFEQTIKEAPSTISVVNRDQIRNFGWVSLNDVLAKQPGFSITQDYERQTMSSRGVFESWNSNHMLMLIDGVPVNYMFGGTGMTGEATPLAFTKSIEIIRGPGSALYGSNATNGVIGLRSISAEDLGKKNVEIRYRRASWNTDILDLTVGAKTDNIAFVSSFNSYNTDGFNYNSLDASNSGQFKINNGKNSTYLLNKLEGRGRFSGLSFQHHEQGSFFSTGHGWLNIVPDINENMNEKRRILILSYKTPSADKKLQQEYVLKYGRHLEDYFQRFYPSGSAYPNGLTEVVKAVFRDYFARAQFTYKLKEKSNVLGGVEYSFFDYKGDITHLSNANLNTDYSPTTNNELVDVGRYLAWYDKGYNSGGIYSQFNTEIVNGLSATVGLRYDLAWFSYKDLETDGSSKNKSLSKLNPRLSLVYSPTAALTFKLMGGQAFRTPSPFELFVGNSYNGVTNPKGLKPETVKTFEFSTDYSIDKNMTWRLNFYRTEMDNVIAYGGAANILTNLLSTTTQGIETELAYNTRSVSGFINYSYAQRVDESASYPSLSIHEKKLTWYPAHLANAGISYQIEKINLSLQAHYQGVVNRRDSDRSPAYDALRGEKVKSWVTGDAKVSYKISDVMTIGLQANNIADSKGMLFKTYNNPYDYRITGRRLMVDLQFRF